MDIHQVHALMYFIVRLDSPFFNLFFSAATIEKSERLES